MRSVEHGCDTVGRFQTRVAYLIELLGGAISNEVSVSGSTK